MISKSGGRSSREKGNRRERELVAAHQAIGIKAERVPLSGSVRYQGNGSDLDIYALGDDMPALKAEVKARKSGAGFTMITRWLTGSDILFVQQDQDRPGVQAPPPVVVIPWATWARILNK